MIPAICINDKNRPNDFPSGKWIKAEKLYHITEIKTVLPQQILGVKVFEIELGPDTMPYLFFDIKRFAVPKEHYAKLIEMMKGDGLLFEGIIQGVALPEEADVVIT